MYMSEAPYTNTNSDFKTMIFLANNDMDTLIIYPLSISYAYDTNATQKTPEIGWKPVYVVKDTGYLKIPVKSFSNLSKGNFHAKIVLKLKNNRDSTFTLCLPEIFSRCVK